MSSSRSHSLPDPKAQARSLCNSADDYRIQGQSPKAEPIYLDALGLAEHAFGPDHPELSGILNNLAVLYKYTGKFEEAEHLYRRALAITERDLGLAHTDAATIYHNLGGLEHARGRYA